MRRKPSAALMRVSWPSQSTGYAALGFVQYGLELKALKVAGRHYDEVLMALDLTVASEP